MGSEATPMVVKALRSSDEFVRNSAAEVLQNTGVVDGLIARLADEPDDELAAAAVQSVFAAGGTALAEAAVERSDPRVTVRARELQAAAALRAS
jgi:HEAT repeat protein